MAARSLVVRTSRVAAAALLAGGALAAGPAAPSLAVGAPLAVGSPLASVAPWAGVAGMLPRSGAPRTYTAPPRSPVPFGPAGLYGRARPLAGSPPSTFLSGVAAISSGDIWAVGSSGSTPVAEHWDGSAWSQVTAPAPAGAGTSTLNAVSAVSANDVWAVGTDFSTAGPQLTLIEHWDGSTWSVVPSPNLGSDINQLNGIAAISADDVWAVGNTLVGGVIETQIEHWNGSTWSVVPSPNVPGVNANQLNQLTVVSARNIWAVGYWAVLDQQYATLAEHWNGTSWTIVKTPASASVNYDLQGAAPHSLSARDIWAVGSIYDNTAQTFRSLAEHWNGKSWKRVQIPSQPGSPESVLFNAAELDSNDVWADGWYEVPGGDEAPLMEHWDGTNWRRVKTPQIPNVPYYDLFSLAGVAADDIWAVGAFTPDGSVWFPLYEHWNGAAWTIVG
jgi:hypothetical protein